MITPVLSHHCRQRCREMGISTKVVKRIVQHATLRMPGYPGPNGEPRTMVRSTSHFPEYVVITDDTTDVAITVMWWSPEQYLERPTCPPQPEPSRKQ